jgi:DNA-directed RNA polymerase subunit RPC12/RpoP
MGQYIDKEVLGSKFSCGINCPNCGHQYILEGVQKDHGHIHIIASY